MALTVLPTDEPTDEPTLDPALDPNVEPKPEAMIEARDVVDVLEAIPLFFLPNVDSLDRNRPRYFMIPVAVAVKNYSNNKPVSIFVNSLIGMF